MQAPILKSAEMLLRCPWACIVKEIQAQIPTVRSELFRDCGLGLKGLRLRFYRV